VKSEILYLSAADIESAAPGPDEARNAILAAFSALHHDRATSPPKQSNDLGAGFSFQSRMATWQERGFAAIKWIGLVPIPPGSTVPGIHATIILNDYNSGSPLAIMEGNVLTGIRTAAMSAAAAIKLAREDARSIGLIGCGLQARYHLKALKAARPSLVDIVAYSRSQSSVDALVRDARADGWNARSATSPEDAIRGRDIVVTTVPMAPGFQSFLDTAWIEKGAFVSAVDISRSWKPDTLRALDILVTDSHEQQAGSPLLAPGLGPAGTFEAELAELAANAHSGRINNEQRAMFIFRGLGLADLAIAAEIYNTARKRKIGTLLPV
jgi:alanine dehydrogenase